MTLSLVTYTDRQYITIRNNNQKHKKLATIHQHALAPYRLVTKRLNLNKATINLLKSDKFSLLES